MSLKKWIPVLMCAATIATCLSGQVRAQEEVPPTGDGAPVAYEEPPTPSPYETNSMNGTASIIAFDLKLNATGSGTTFTPATLGKPLTAQATQQDVNEALNSLETFYTLNGMTANLDALRRTRNGQLTVAEQNSIKARSKVAISVAYAQKRVGGCLWVTEIVRSWWQLGRNEHITYSAVLGKVAGCPIDRMSNVAGGTKSSGGTYSSSYSFAPASRTYSRQNAGIGPGRATNSSLFKGLSNHWAPYVVGSYSI